MKRVWTPRLAAACVVLTALCGTGCEREHWRVGERARASDRALTLALGDTAHQYQRELTADQIPDLPYPRSLRPCCAFGADLKVEVGSIPVPGVELGNLVDPSETGPHRYDNGYLSIDTSDERGLVDLENNGLIYTCRGGFIDVAHVRDNADNTLALTAAVLRMMETGGTYDVPPQGATMRVRLKPISPAAIERVGERVIAPAMARWLAYQLSVWHEIATFYGYASIAEWPEKISAFSPEDLYSNELGARIANGIAMSGGARSDAEYQANMDAWLRRVLERLGAVSLEDSRTAMREVDGLWWDSTKRIPDWTLVKRRQLDPGPYLEPWRLEVASPGPKGPIEPLAACRDAGPPLVLEVEDGLAGRRFDEFASVEFDVDDTLAAQGFPFPRAGSRSVTQRDFPFVIAKIRAAVLDTFGEGADRP